MYGFGSEMFEIWIFKIGYQNLMAVIGFLGKSPQRFCSGPGKAPFGRSFTYVKQTGVGEVAVSVFTEVFPAGIKQQKNCPQVW